MNETAEIVKALQAQGWRVELRKGGHYMAFPPDKTRPAVTFSATPRGGRRSIENTIAQLRRSGFVWKGR